MTVDGLLTMAVDLSVAAPPGSDPPPGSVTRLSPARTAEIGALYWRSYPTGQAWASEAESVADIAASFAGAYGPLWDAASLGASVDGRLAAVVLTVRRPIWSDTPDGPFVIEVFTDPDRRRSHLAAHLLRRVLTVAAAAGEITVGLRVGPDNAPALALYRSLGFGVFTAGDRQASETTAVTPLVTDPTSPLTRIPDRGRPLRF